MENQEVKQITHDEAVLAEIIKIAAQEPTVHQAVERAKDRVVAQIREQQWQQERAQLEQELQKLRETNGSSTLEKVEVGKMPVEEPTI